MPTTTTTLRALNNLDDTPATLADSTLILVDYQNTYVSGVMELHGWRTHLTPPPPCWNRPARSGSTVIRVVNDGVDVCGQIDTGEGGGGLDDDRLALGGGHARVDHADLGPDVVGFMTHMCVLATTRSAFRRGNRPIVVADACATRPLRSADTDLTAVQIHHRALAMIGDLYGVVVASGKSLT
ncbi:isochorismatase family protein (plasmid) [Streptomyces sp. NBC_00015]|uniref:isochorismatase family protein n=1 Tax=Streptomyces sp. NBC_00015 TaxID=2903611 RepID=UPI002F90CD40